MDICARFIENNSSKYDIDVAMLLTKSCRADPIQRVYLLSIVVLQQSCGFV